LCERCQPGCTSAVKIDDLLRVPPPSRIAPMPPFDRLVPILLLLGSNIFMTFAWYGHLKYKSSALFPVILISWGIAFFEYCLMVPANRLGSAFYSAPQLKGMQE